MGVVHRLVIDVLVNRPAEFIDTWAVILRANNHPNIYKETTFLFSRIKYAIFLLKLLGGLRYVSKLVYCNLINVHVWHMLYCTTYTYRFGFGRRQAGLTCEDARPNQNNDGS